MQDLEPLSVFVRVAELHSFTEAAQQLGIQKGRASTLIRRLENEVGVALLHRTTRQVQLTTDGRIFYTRACDLLAEAEDLRTMFSSADTALSGRLRVDMPTELAQSVVVPALPDLTDGFPQLQLELSSTDRQVDLLAEGFDCVIRLGPIVDDTLVARPLGKLRMINAASPAYLSRFGTPYTLEHLHQQSHRMVHYTPTLGDKRFGWEYPDDGVMRRSNYPARCRSTTSRPITPPDWRGSG